MAHPIHNVLTIAGSDCSGGAGIQADLKTFSALGVYGASVVTALTAQNTHGVRAVHAPEDAFVAAQLDAVFEDIDFDAVKIGMLANAGIVRAVASALRRHAAKRVVLDTVILSKNGHPLLSADAVAALREELMPLADLVTPNLDEAAVLVKADARASDEAAMRQQGDALRALGARAVLMKGGHLGGTQSPDWLIDDSGPHRLDGARIDVKDTHGTGCTLSAAIAALIPHRQDWLGAVTDAKTYLAQALRESTRLRVGSGIGPVHHFHRWW
jgi:hydroxymethylpyrimidine/phosphomethylpyrimidine kinase